jgi:hypothetical protein
MSDEDQVETMRRIAQQSGLAIADDDLERVKPVFANFARVAGQLMAFALPAEIEAAPVFTPGGKQK